MKQFKIHLFDLDDTITNSCQSYLKAYSQVFRDSLNGQLIPTLNQIYRFCRQFGSGNPFQVFEALLCFYDLNSKNSLKKMEQDFWRYFWDNLKSFNRVEDYLKILSKNSITIGLISNGCYEQQLKKLEKVDVKKYFNKNNIYVSSLFKAQEKKPAPTMISKILKQNKFKPEEACFYGNADLDIIAGKLAGVTTILMELGKFFPEQKDNFFKADYSFKSWQQLIDKIGK